MSSCGEITDEDIIDFVMADTSYPFSKLLHEFQDGKLDPRNQVDALAIRAFVKKKLKQKSGTKTPNERIENDPRISIENDKISNDTGDMQQLA